MSSTKRFGLSQLATQNVKCRGGLGSACILYRNNPTTDRLMCTTATVHNESNKDLGNVNELEYQRRSDHQSRLTNLIGVKRTLVNRMQGMLQNSRQKSYKTQQITHTLNSYKYNICGQTRIFNSLSSVTKNPELGLMSPPHRDFSSHISPSYNIHQRYEPVNSQRVEDVAKDISRSIQSELMDVDRRTKDLICVRSKYDNSSDNDGIENREYTPHRRPYYAPKQSFDPLDGWNHPTAIKPVDPHSISSLLETQRKPLRRKSVSIRFKGDLQEFVSSKQTQLKQPVLQIYRSPSQLGETYVKYAKQRTLRHAQSLGDDSDKLMSRQPNSFGNATSQMEDDRRSKSGDLLADDATRMDNERYPTKTASNLMSASQRLFNKRTDTVRKPANARDMAMEVMLVKNAAQHITSSAIPTLQPIPKIRPVSMFRVDSLKGSKRNRQSGQNQNQVSNSFGSLSAWKRGKSNESIEATYVGEKRPRETSQEDVRDKDDSLSQDKSQNTISMPDEYTKQSAVQRLGVTKKNATHLIYLQQRGRI